MSIRVTIYMLMVAFVCLSCTVQSGIVSADTIEISQSVRTSTHTGGISGTSGVAGADGQAGANGRDGTTPVVSEKIPSVQVAESFSLSATSTSAVSIHTESVMVATTTGTTTYTDTAVTLTTLRTLLLSLQTALKTYVQFIF